jgi:spore coat protein H
MRDNNKNKNNNWILIILITAFILFGASSTIYTNIQDHVENVVDVSGSSNSSNISTLKYFLQDNRSVYSQDTNVAKDIYITVLDSSKEKHLEDASLEKISFAKMNTLNNASPNYSLEVIMQEGNADGPVQGLYGYGLETANGIINIRGNSTSNSTQKSYKVTLYKSASLWDGQRIINFIKHPYDLTRVRNAVCFALFQTIPNITSLRSQFVHLYIKDLSASKSTGKFVDYGLYEQLEQPNSKFLASHGLDPTGNLYKATNFQFYRYTDIIRQTDDPLYSKKDMSQLIEQKNGSNNKKLIEMLDAVNDYSRNFNDIFDQYFDRDNFLTWLAANILMDNRDTNSQNYYLYNPSNSDKWYFLPWDYDGALDWYNQAGQHVNYMASWESGLSLYWQVVLDHRFFSDPDNLKQLEAKIEELGKYINKTNIQNLLSIYYPIISSNINAKPDIDHLPGTSQDFDREFWRLADVPDKTKASFYKNIEKPMPINLGVVDQEDETFTFSWDSSYDLQGDDIYYSFILASDPSMQKVLIEKDFILKTSIKIPALGKGRYYWKVYIYDTKGNQQTAFDKYEDEFGNYYFGEASLVVG